MKLMSAAKHRNKRARGKKKKKKRRRNSNGTNLGPFRVKWWLNLSLNAYSTCHASAMINVLFSIFMGKSNMKYVGIDAKQDNQKRSKQKFTAVVGTLCTQPYV